MLPRLVIVPLYFSWSGDNTDCFAQGLWSWVYSPTCILVATLVLVRATVLLQQQTRDCTFVFIV